VDRTEEQHFGSSKPKWPVLMDLVDEEEKGGGGSEIERNEKYHILYQTSKMIIHW
jgi:hypothetical protein